MVERFAIDHNLPCKNVNCKEHGHPHFGCKCYGSRSGAQTSTRGTNAPSIMQDNGYAGGGTVESKFFCDRGEAHEPGCQYFLAGGPVAQLPAPQAPDDIHQTLGMHGVHSGLLNMLTQVGHPKLMEPEKHGKHLDKAIQKQDPEKMADHLHEHVLSGGASRKNLSPIMARLAGPLATQEQNPVGARAGIDYLNSSLKGESKLDSHMEGLLGSNKMPQTEEPDPRPLQDHLEDLKMHPEKMLDIGGSLGHYLQEHAAGLGYQAAQATQYLEGLKPKTNQLAPLDTVEQVDRAAQAKYDRQCRIAENPLILLKNMKSGTILPSDIMTVSTIYPGLHKAMVSKAMEQLVSAKTNKTEIPYRQRQGLSLLLGQPLSYCETPQAAQAIMASAMPKQPPQQSPGKPKGKSGATAAELKAIDKSNEMAETPLEKRLINKK